MILLLIQLFKSTVLLPLIIIHLLLICSIMFQLLQLLTEGHPTTELFVWFWLVIYSFLNLSLVNSDLNWHAMRFLIPKFP